MSDTPRTNKESFFPHDSKYQVCDADFCRQLERELNAANAKAQSFYEHILKHKEENALLTAKIEEHRRTIKELEEENDAMKADLLLWNEQR